MVNFESCSIFSIGGALLRIVLVVVEIGESGANPGVTRVVVRHFNLCYLYSRLKIITKSENDFKIWFEIWLKSRNHEWSIVQFNRN